MFTVFATFTFEGAHRLPMVPEGHKCGRLHGHNWTVEIQCSGEVDERTGWLVDFYDIQKTWDEKIYTALDHRLLNDVPGLSNPTTEIIAQWIWSQMKPRLPQLSAVIVRETPAFGATYRGHL